MRRDAHGVSQSALLHILWYVCAMFAGRLIFHRYYDALRVSRVEGDVNYHHPRVNLHLVLRVPLKEFP